MRSSQLLAPLTKLKAGASTNGTGNGTKKAFLFEVWNDKIPNVKISNVQNPTLKISNIHNPERQNSKR